MLHDLKIHGGWGWDSVLRGPSGIRGKEGSRGGRGPQGITGPTGPIGPTGMQGQAGDRGPVVPGAKAEKKFYFIDPAEMPIHVKYDGASSSSSFEYNEYYWHVSFRRESGSQSGTVTLKFRDDASGRRVYGSFYVGFFPGSAYDQFIGAKVELDDSIGTSTQIKKTVDIMLEGQLRTVTVRIGFPDKTASTISTVRVTDDRSMISCQSQNTDYEEDMDKRIVYEAVDGVPTRGSFFSLVSSGGVASAFCGMIDNLPATAAQKADMKRIFGAT